MFDLQDRFARVAEQMSRLQKLQRRSQELEHELQQLKSSVARLQAEAGREDQDVERLEGSSLAGIFYAFLGSREKQLEKERQEALAAHLKHDQAVKRLQALEAENVRLYREMGELAGAEKEYQELLRQKEAYLAQAGASEFFSFGEREQELAWKLQQLQEAQAAGRQAESHLDRVIDHLNSAENWGTWDMLGGGWLATAVKHSRMDEARDAATAAQRSLDTFRRELKDVTVETHFELAKLDGFTRFADYFFDGLIVDWAVQNRIRESLQSVRRTRSHVSGVLASLERTVQETNVSLQRLRAEKTRFIEQYQG